MLNLSRQFLEFIWTALRHCGDLRLRLQPERAELADDRDGAIGRFARLGDLLSPSLELFGGRGGLRGGECLLCFEIDDLPCVVGASTNRRGFGGASLSA